MNVFYLANDVKECATFHVNKHVVKMIVEYAQLLSTAHRVLDGTVTVVKSKTGRNTKKWLLPNNKDALLYKATHINHPSAVWVRQSVDNYTWLHSMLLALLDEYTFRYGKVHKCAEIAELLADPPANIPVASFTAPTPAMPDECVIDNDVIESYRTYYRTKKQHIANWSGKVNGREVPDWY